MMRSVRMPAINLLPAEVIEAFAEGLNATKAFLEVRRRRERSRTRRRPLTPRDRSRGNGLVDHAWIAHPDRRAWRKELRKMLASGLKCDLEAVCVKPRGGSDFGRLSKFVKSAIVNENWL